MIIIAVALLVVLATIALALVFGGPRRPAPMSSISAPFAQVDFSDLPELSTFRAEDGQALAYRQYRPCSDTGSGSVLLVHGSSAGSASMHLLAKAMAAAGFAVYALDMRGHGASGRRGHIDRIGRLELDLEGFVRGTPAPAIDARRLFGGRWFRTARRGQRRSEALRPLLAAGAVHRRSGAYAAPAQRWMD